MKVRFTRKPSLWLLKRTTQYDYFNLKGEKGLYPKLQGYWDGRYFVIKTFDDFRIQLSPKNKS